MQQPVIEYFLEQFQKSDEAPALAYRDELYSYRWLLNSVGAEKAHLRANGIGVGSVVVLISDYTPQTVAVLLALVKLKAIIIPVLPGALDRSDNILEITCPQFSVTVTLEGSVEIRLLQARKKNLPLISALKQRESAGLILFTSGSTGEPKAVVHDFSLLLEKFRVPRTALVTLNFLLFDHWGGLNTLLHGLSNRGLVVLPERRTPEYICNLIEKYGVELLPATPTFLNMLLLSQRWKSGNLGSLKIISYGAEPMPDSTLEGLRKAFPDVELRQTYGLIELGVLRAKSRDSGSLWVKLGGEGYKLRVLDGILQIKADAAMLGYLNAPSPITKDGYFITGDQVEVDGEYFRILGRETDLINVGGEKVFPSEIEAVLLSATNIKDALVYGEKHPMMGEIVCANVMLIKDEPERELRIRLKKACKAKLEGFKVPVKINIATDGLYTNRMKKDRSI
jgi:long-chain acyl-CoA synthetase